MADDPPSPGPPSASSPIATAPTQPPAPPAPGPSPARWAAAGVLGGVSIMGMLWSILGRAPAPIEPLAATPPAVRQIDSPVPEPAPQPKRKPAPLPATQDAERRAAERPTSDAPLPSFARAEGDPIRSAQEPGRLEIATQPEPESQPEAPPTIPSNPSTGPIAEPSAPRRPAALTERLNINRATQAELELLPNIGPTLATRIIAFREAEGAIRSLTHLTDVRGIGLRTAEAIEPYLRFD